MAAFYYNCAIKPMTDSDQPTESIANAILYKRNAEAQIREVIDQFQRQTNLVVESIDFDRRLTLGGPSCISITIKAALP